MNENKCTHIAVGEYEGQHCKLCGVQLFEGWYLEYPERTDDE